MSHDVPLELVPHEPYVPSESLQECADGFLNLMRRRRTIRHFSDRPVPESLIETLVSTAATAPSGANKQPWRFVCVSDADVKRQIRVAAEAEEREFYERRASEEWLKDLAPLGTDSDKPFLEVAPWLICVFKLTRADDGGQVYYPTESVGLACGFLLAAAHQAGLVTLTHTPSPMGFLTRVLNRPANERPYLLIPIGYPEAGCHVPQHAMWRRPLREIMVTV